MTLEEAKRIVLFQAFEDVHGLWEIVRERPIFEIADRQERLELARKAVMELLGEGSIRLRLYSALGRRAVQEIDEGGWDRVLSDSASWEVPRPRAAFVGFESTREGDAKCRADPW